MGDVIHTLPALTDAKSVYPYIKFDWVVEPSFAEIPKWHRAVKEVIPSPLRRWRKSPWQSYKQGEWHAFIRCMRYASYDLIIDAQGLMKSAFISTLAKGKRVGLDRQSAREPLASLFYQQSMFVEKGQHAVERVRQLFAKALSYPIPQTPPDYGIDKNRLVSLSYGDNTVIFLHGTTWPTKHWPEQYWQQLAHMLGKDNVQVLLPWGNEQEKVRAEGIRHFCLEKKINVVPMVLPKLSIAELTALIAKAKGIVAVDTGLGHIAAAMAAPTVSLYGSTDPGLTGAYGPNQQHLQVNASCSPCLSRQCKQGENFAVMPPCFESLPPEKVYQELTKMMNTHKEHHEYAIEVV